MTARSPNSDHTVDNSTGLDKLITTLNLEGGDQREGGEKALPAIETGIAVVDNSNYNLILGICIDNKNRIHDYRDLN
ncbi:MAG: hypothetical protein ACREBR_03715 [bacterium]